MMPRFFVYSKTGDGDSLAYRLKQEGYEVVLRVDEDWSRPNLEGLVPRTDREPRQDEIVVFGTSKSSEKAVRWQKAGIRCVASAPICDRLEMDRHAFVQTCAQLGIDTPESYHFTNYEQARDFLRERGDRWVFKPEGDTEAWTTYVSTDAEDMLGMLDTLERKIPKADFLLQHFEEGVEVSCEGWFNGRDWIEGAWNCTFECKKFMNDDIGPATGCSCAVVYPYDREPKWAQLHRQFTPLLSKDEYRGPWDLNLIVTRNTLYALEPTPRFGYHAIENFAELWEHPFGEIMERLVYGALGRLDVETDLLAASVRLSVPPYPNASPQHRASRDIPVHIDEGDLRRLWPSGLRRDREDGALYTAPSDGVIGALVAHGATLERAVPKLLEAAGRIRIPQLQYRTDIAAGHGDKWQQLAKWGFSIPPTARKLLKDAPPPMMLGGRGLGLGTFEVARR